MAWNLFQNESGGKYLTLLDSETLPQYSDVVLVIAQYAAVLNQFREQHTEQNPANFDMEWKIKKQRNNSGVKWRQELLSQKDPGV